MPFSMLLPYGTSLHSEVISWVAKDMDPVRIDTVTVAVKEYQASYFGKEDLTGILDGYISREFWRLENAYDDFKTQPKTGDVLPYHNFPMLAETGQVFAIDCTQTDGSVTRLYYRTDGYVWNGSPSAEEFSAD